MADAHEQGGARTEWRIIVVRARREGANPTPFSGLGYHHWQRELAVENSETGALSAWVSGQSWEALAKAARGAGVDVGTLPLQMAWESASAKWQHDHPPKRCPDCFESGDTPPRGKHRPASHIRRAPWQAEMGGSPDLRDADDREVARIWPDGSYEVPHV